MVLGIQALYYTKICIYCLHESLKHTEYSRIRRRTVQQAGFMTKLESTSFIDSSLFLRQPLIAGMNTDFYRDK